MAEGGRDNNLYLSEWYMYQEGKAIVSESKRSVTRKKLAKTERQEMHRDSNICWNTE